MVQVDRRHILKLGAATFLPQVAAPPVPRVNGGINLFPLRRFETEAGFTLPLIVPRLVDVQLQLVYELGYEHIRITIPFEEFGPNFLAAIPYVRAARALGIDVLGVFADFTGFALVRALSNTSTRDEVLETYARIFGDFVLKASPSVERTGRFAAQILNEPTFFTGIGPEAYVREFLRPAYLHLKEDDPGIEIIAAAPVASAEGFLRAQRMLEAGVEHFCDRLAYHFYTTRFVERLARLAHKPVWITESGVSDTARHFDWITRTFSELRRGFPQAERIYWFDLFDLNPGGFRLVDIIRDPVSEFEAVVESEAVIELLRNRVTEATGGARSARYEELIPDIRLYFPTEEDIRIIEETSFGLADGR